MIKNDTEWLDSYLTEFNGKINPNNSLTFIEFKEELLKVKSNNSKVILFGNGASNTIADHASIDFTNLIGLKCISLNSSGLLTAFSNDFGYDRVLERYLYFNLDKNDLLVLISSSGESPNVINGATFANEKGNKIVTFTGFKESNTLKSKGDINFWVNSTNYNIVESIHNLWIVTLAEIIAKDNKNIGKHGISHE